MGMIGTVIRVSQEVLNTFLDNSELLENKLASDECFDAEWLLDLDKSWDGINYILTGKRIGEIENVPNSLERALFSYQIIDQEQDLGYGPAQYLDSNQVKETQVALHQITEEALRTKADGSKMDALGIYPGVWSDADAIEFLLDSFEEFREFFKKAAENEEAIITFLS